jgi:apolipoprotein N-acyltransferase
MLVRVASWCYTRRRLVVVLWIAALFGAIAASSAFGGRSAAIGRSLAAVLILLRQLRVGAGDGAADPHGVFGIGIGAALISLLANVLEVPDFAPSVAAMIGIGVGIDYALFIVTRYRGLARRPRPAPGGRQAIATAGRPCCSPASR